MIITGHIDSRVTDPMNATADAPGANDDGSGTAAARSWPNTRRRRAGTSSPTSTTTSSATAAAPTECATPSRCAS
ncbi:MAG: M28 family peptidase, partial [Sphingomicrobium sp.]